MARSGRRGSTNLEESYEVPRPGLKASELPACSTLCS